MTAVFACATWPAPCRALHNSNAQPHQQRLSERAAVSRRHAVASNPSRAAAATTAALRRQWRRPAPAPAAAAEQQEASNETSSETTGVITTQRLANLRYYTPDGLWVVRPLDKGNMAEVRRVVQIQTDAFHTPAALPVLDGLAKSFFEAEVLSEMSKKLRFNPQELFISLVIESAGEHNNGSNTSNSSEASSNEASNSGSSSSSTNGSSSSNGNGSSFGAGSGSNGSSSSSSSTPGVLGVVEISYMAAKDTLARLEPGTEGFCYVASMVVAPGWRRRGAAQALLRAAELAAEAWEERQTVLHVYQDNEAAVQLYRRAGYEVLHAQPRTWAVLGNRPRYLMRKQW